MAHTKQSAEISQLHRLQGQLSGVEKMLTGKQSLCDVLQQLEAVRGSIVSLERQLLHEKAKQLKDSELRKSWGYLLKVS